MPKIDFVYSDPSLSDFVPSNNPTPYGIYDADSAFVSESIDVAKYVSKKLGHPVMQLEFNSASIWACFEESVSDYSQYINNYNAKNWLWDNYGNTSRVSGSGYSNVSNSERMGTGSMEPQKPNLGSTIYLSDKYGETVGVGGDADLKSGSITLSKNEQDYDLQALWGDVSESKKRIEIQRVFNYGPAALSKFYDPFAGSYDQRTLLDEMGMGNVSPSVSFILRPIHWDITRANTIETNDKVRKSNYSFELINNKLRVFPRPGSSDAGNKLYFKYYVRDDRVSNTRSYTNLKVSDPSNIPYKFITYSEINAPGRQWIRRYTLALAKELLGIIRSKYATMPVPGGEVNMDGEALKAEGREEKTVLIDELKEFLDSLSLTERTRQEQEQADAQQSVLNKAPLMIYLG